MSVLKTLPFRKNFVMITMVDFKGSVPQTLGAKAVVLAEGLHSGTVGGGKVEMKAIEFSKSLLQNAEAPKCQLVEWNLTTDVGMTCGGVVTFLFEIFKFNQWNIAVFGAGHVAQELVPMLTRLETSVTVCDARSEWLDRLAPADNLVKKLLPEPKTLVTELPSNTYFILMSQGHATDLPVLMEILRLGHNPPYVGVIGSKTKAVRLKNDLKAMIFPDDKIKSFFCPIGLDIGDNTPVEISHSVVAQILQVRKQNEHK